MKPNDPDLLVPTSSGEHTGTDPFTAGDAILDRARAVARQITERVRQLAGENDIDGPALPGADERLGR